MMFSLVRRAALWIIGFASALIAAAIVLTGLMQAAQPQLAQQLAFQSNRSGNWDIYLLDLNTRLLINLTNHPADDLYPTWSASTDALAFYSSRQMEERTGLYIADGRAQVEPLRIGGAFYWRPNWSPDGKRLVFMVGYNEIRVMNRDGSSEQQIALGFSPTWSPVGSQILYYSDRAGDLTPDLYQVDENGSQPKNLTRSATAEWDGAWSPDGQWIVYTASVADRVDLFIMPAACPEQSAACVPRRLTDSTGNNTAPAWSPDGSLIAFSAEHTGRSQIHIINADGTNERQITFGDSDNALPAWKH